MYYIKKENIEFIRREAPKVQTLRPQSRLSPLLWLWSRLHRTLGRLRHESAAGYSMAVQHPWMEHLASWCYCSLHERFFYVVQFLDNFSSWHSTRRCFMRAGNSKPEQWNQAINLSFRWKDTGSLKPILQSHREMGVNNIQHSTL